MKLKISEKTKGCMPEIFEEGEWIDLKTSKDIELKKWGSAFIPFGVCMEIPEGYEVLLAPRSSAFKDWGIIQTNSVGVIDKTYCGDTDIIKMPVIATKAVFIPKGKRIAQFRIQLSQKATVLQKIKDLFSGSIEMVPVEFLGNKARGGFGEGTKNK